jgi:hypothetical protein
MKSNVTMYFGSPAYHFRLASMVCEVAEGGGDSHIGLSLWWKLYQIMKVFLLIGHGLDAIYAHRLSLPAIRSFYVLTPIK